MENTEIEKRRIEVEKATYAEKSGRYNISAIQLKVNPFKRKNSEPYIRESSGRYVGELPVVLVGDILEIEVKTRYDQKFGNWHEIISATRVNPVMLRQVERFLRKNIPGITPDRLSQILDKYGLDTLQAIQKDPHSLDFAGLLPEDSEALRDALNNMAAYEEIVIILGGNGVDCRYAFPLYREYGVTAPRILQSNPYTPYVAGCYDFQSADQLFTKLGHSPDDPMRCRYSIVAMLESESIRHGDLLLHRNCLEEELTKFLHEEKPPFTDDIIEDSLGALKKLGLIDIETSFGGTEIYLHKNYMTEQTAAEDIQRVWLGEKQFNPSPEKVREYLSQGSYSLDPKQEEAILTALTSPITIISGGPGTGKTHTIHVIVDAISTLCPTAKIQLCAPTGRAAVRIGEVTGREACTIHRMLDLKQYKREHAKPIELGCDYLVVDEVSMVDMDLCHYLFAAATSKIRVIIVGDHNQLPSIGPGQVLKDMISAGVFPVVTLSRVFRQDAQSSRNIKNANIIIDTPEGKGGELKAFKPDRPGGDFYLLEKKDPRSIQDKIVEVVEKAIKEFHVPLESIAVLTPIHGGPLGTDELNTLLQNKLNPSTEKINFKAQEFRLRDKVIHIETDYTLEVYNGEIGFVDEIENTSSNALTVDYAKKKVTYPRKKLEKLDLAYAMTVHKMQGSECRVVVMPVYNNNLSKSILYTAFTRAQKSVVLIGSQEELSKGLRRTEPDRNSNLCKRLQAQILHKSFASPPDVKVPEEPAADSEQQQSLFTTQPASE